MPALQKNRAIPMCSSPPSASRRSHCPRRLVSAAARMSVSAAVGRSPFRARLSTRGTGVPWLVLVLLFVATCSWGLSGSVVSAEASGASVPDEVSVADRNEPWTQYVVRILYGVLAEVFWIFTGLVVGVAAVFAGANFRINSRGNPGLGFVWFFTSPACAVISGIAASACLANGTSFEDRVRICGGVNCAMFAVLYLFAATV